MITHLQVEPTTRCNFTCSFCCGRHLRQADMGLEDFVALLQDCPDLRYLQLQGEGEPLLNPRFFEMVEAARKIYPGAHISFCTNGSLFSEWNIDRILELMVDDVCVSIDSTSPELFGDLRGGKYEKVISGTRKLLREKAARSQAAPTVGLASTILRRTIGDLMPLVSLYKSLALDGGFGVQFLQTMDAYRRHYPPELLAEVLADDEIDEAKRSHPETFQEIKVLNDALKTQNFYQSLYRDWEPTSCDCPWLQRGMYVGAAGVVTTCCFVKEDCNASLGVLNETDIGQMLEKRKAVREQLRSEVIPVPCRGCSIIKGASGKWALKWTLD